MLTLITMSHPLLIMRSAGYIGQVGGSFLPIPYTNINWVAKSWSNWLNRWSLCHQDIWQFSYSGQVEAAKGRANKFVNSILRLSNVEAAWKYLVGSGRSGSMPVSSGFYTKVIGSAVTDVEVISMCYWQFG